MQHIQSITSQKNVEVILINDNGQQAECAAIDRVALLASYSYDQDQCSVVDH